MRKIAIIAVSCMLLSACFSPYQGDTGTITIGFGGSDARGAVWPGIDGPGALYLVDHHITLKGPSGTITRTSKGGTTVRISVAPGVWEVTVEDMCYGMPFATGVSEPFEVKAGQNEPARIVMKPTDTIFYAAGSGAEFTQAIEDSSDAAADYNSIALILTNSFSMTAYSGFDAYLNKPLTIIGNGHSITLSGTGSLFSISGGSVTIQNLHLKGQGDAVVNNAPLVSVTGTFIMESGSISGNTVNSGIDGIGVNIDGGTFIMNGGTISSNISNFGGSGGGVCINVGTFTMNGGVISGNTANYGGGVAVLGSNSILRMKGGIIYGSNESTSSLRNYGPTGGAALYCTSAHRHLWPKWHRY